jgi:hypothetical protein
MFPGVRMPGLSYVYHKLETMAEGKHCLRAWEVVYVGF